MRESNLQLINLFKRYQKNENLDKIAMIKIVMLRQLNREIKRYLTKTYLNSE